MTNGTRPEGWLLPKEDTTSTEMTPYASQVQAIARELERVKNKGPVAGLLEVFKIQNEAWLENLAVPAILAKLENRERILAQYTRTIEQELELQKVTETARQYQADAALRQAL